MTDWAQVRAQFPALQRWTYLNTATFGQVPRCAVEAIERHLAHRDELACFDFLDWFTDHDGLREKLARLINSTPDEIAFVSNASSGLALVMNGIDWREGDEAVTLAGEFPNQIYAPSAHHVKLLERPWPDLLAAIGPKTRLVAVSEVNYSTGFRVPLEQLAAAARKAGALFYVDGTQSLGALQFDWQDIQPDVFSVNTYKWMLTPNGVSFMAVHPRVREMLPPIEVGWRSHYDWRNVNNLHHGPPVFKTTAEKYEGGMLASSLLYALEAVVDLMLELGPAAIEERCLALAAETRRVLAAAGGDLIPDTKSPITCAAFSGRDAGEMSLSLKEQGILVSARHGHLRVSTHFYNTETDLARLRDRLPVS